MSKWYKKSWIAVGWLIVAQGLSGSVQGQEDTEVEPPATEKQRAVISSGLGSEAIAAQRPEHAVWLDLDGDDTGLALFAPEQRTPARGAMVMLADEGESAASGLLAAIGEGLASGGWGVMTLGLAAPPYELQQAWKMAAAELPQAPDDSGGEAPDSVMIDVMDDGERDDLEDRYRERIQSLLAAAAADLQERGYQRVVLVGVGAGAIHVTRAAAAGTANELVWLTPRFYPRDESGVDELLAGVESLALLHLHSSREQGQGEAARERAVRLKKAGVDGYQTQPAAIGARAEVRDARALASRLRSWLKSM